MEFTRRTLAPAEAPHKPKSKPEISCKFLVSILEVSLEKGCLQGPRSSRPHWLHLVTYNRDTPSEKPQATVKTAPHGTSENESCLNTVQAYGGPYLGALAPGLVPEMAYHVNTRTLTPTGARHDNESAGKEREMPGSPFE